jgi:hypothetical protein
MTTTLQVWNPGKAWRVVRSNGKCVGLIYLTVKKGVTRYPVTNDNGGKLGTAATLEGAHALVDAFAGKEPA